VEAELTALRKQLSEAKPHHVQQKELGAKIARCSKALDAEKALAEGLKSKLEKAEVERDKRAAELAELEAEEKKLYHKALGADKIDGVKGLFDAFEERIRRKFKVQENASEIFATIRIFFYLNLICVQQLRMEIICKPEHLVVCVGIVFKWAWNTLMSLK
jgi:chromosome segregation ATPase